MTTRFGPAKKNSEKGTAVVETAIALFVFLVLFFGIFEAGRFMNTEQVLTNAAREGARFAVAPMTGTNTVPTDAEVTTHVQDFLNSANIPCSSCVTVTRNVMVTTGSVQTNYTRVVVTNDYQVVAMPGVFDMLQVTLNGNALMRSEISD